MKLQVSAQFSKFSFSWFGMHFQKVIFAFLPTTCFPQEDSNLQGCIDFMGDYGMYSVNICWPTTTEPTTKHFHKYWTLTDALKLW